jgi:hypothetical protein
MAHRVVRRRGFPHFLDNRLTDGGEVVSPTRRPPFTPGSLYPQEDSWYSFPLEAESTLIEKSNDIGIRTRDLLACSIVPQPTTLPRAPEITILRALNKNPWTRLAACLLERKALSDIFGSGRIP